MIKIAICDDMRIELERIDEALKAYLHNTDGPEAEIFLFENPLLLIEHIEKHGGFEILLLDICMPKMNGTEVAREVRRRQDKTEIIFLTTSTEFAVDAFKLKAAHYILKPFTQQQFDEAMSRALETFDDMLSKKIKIKLSGGGMRSSEINKIICIESYLHEQKIHIKNGEIWSVKNSLNGLLEQLETLSPGQFILAYKGYVINLAAVQLVEPDGILLYGGKRVPIVRRKFRELSDLCFKYSFEMTDKKEVTV